MCEDFTFIDLPLRRRPGAPENLMRAIMLPLLIKGLTREEAERIAKLKLEKLGLDTSSLDLQYRND